MKRIVLLVMLILSTSFLLPAKTMNDAEIIIPDSEIYSKIKALQMENKVFFFTQNTPVSVGELKLYLKQFDYDQLSENSKAIYDEIYGELYEEKNLLPVDYVQLYSNPKVNPEFYYKSNKNISWTNNYFFKDNLLTVPIDLGFGNYFAIQSGVFIGKNYIAMQKDKNFTNVPLKIKDMEFFFPNYAYGSAGQTFDNWGYNFHFGKQGKTIGDTLSGSILYNKTFETDGYAELDLYSDLIKYTCDVVQVSSNRMDSIQNDNVDRYMYIHQVDTRLFKKLKFTIFEASLVANPLQFRYLNPLIFMHQYGGWTDYSTPDSDGIYKENYSAYKETNFCAYFASMLEYIPVYNLRLYGIYNQVEMQVSWERSQNRGRYYPNAVGLQVGGEYNLYLPSEQKLNFGLEGIYTSPYMYMKQTPSASLYRYRVDMQTKQKVYSWIGTPFGPDCLAGQFRVQYSPNKNLNCEFDYVLSAKGNNDFNTFNETFDGIYSYYPSVIWYLIKEKDYDMTYDDLYAKAMNMMPTGIPVFTNQFGIQGTYTINNHIDISGKFVYSYVINNLHVKNNNASGVEISLSASYTLFE